MGERKFLRALICLTLMLALLLGTVGAQAAERSVTILRPVSYTHLDVYKRQDITGISYEPWHYRYVGVKAATAIREQDITLEEYVGAGSAG